MQVHPYLALVLRKTLTLAIYIRTQYDYLFFSCAVDFRRYCKNAKSRNSNTFETIRGGATC
jgi:hypothetical protein